jgi:hypothetical protein
MPSPAPTAGRPQPVGAGRSRGAPRVDGAPTGRTGATLRYLIFLALARRCRIMGPCRPVGRKAKLAARRRWARNETYGLTLSAVGGISANCTDHVEVAVRTPIRPRPHRSVVHRIGIDEGALAAGRFTLGSGRAGRRPASRQWARCGRNCVHHETWLVELGSYSTKMRYVPSQVMALIG